MPEKFKRALVCDIDQVLLVKKDDFFDDLALARIDVKNSDLRHLLEINNENHIYHGYCLIFASAMRKIFRACLDDNVPLIFITANPQHQPSGLLKLLKQYYKFSEQDLVKCAFITATTFGINGTSKIDKILRAKSAPNNWIDSAAQIFWLDDDLSQASAAQRHNINFIHATGCVTWHQHQIQQIGNAFLLNLIEALALDLILDHTDIKMPIIARKPEGSFKRQLFYYPQLFNQWLYNSTESESELATGKGLTIICADDQAPEPEDTANLAVVTDEVSRECTWDCGLFSDRKNKKRDSEPRF